MGRACTGLASIALGTALVAGCGPKRRTIHIPDSVVAKPDDGPAKRRIVQPYVIKMSDGQRTWQIEIPAAEAAGAFSAMVPLDLGEAALSPPGMPPTEADREIHGAVAPGTSLPDGEADATTGRGRSYLATLAKVNALFRRRQYELALIEVVAVDCEDPDDERILEMKGTLYWKLRKPKLAREAWERVLAINPDNAVVAQALEHLIGE